MTRGFIESFRQAAGLAAFLFACSPAPPPKPAPPVTRALPIAAAPVTETCARNSAEGSIVVCNLESPGSFHVKNEARTEVQVRSLVDVELEDQDHVWRSTSSVVYLDPQCRADPPTDRCVAVDPGAVLQPFRWSGFTCSGQCRPRCVGNHYLRGWRLRFVITTCDGVHRFAGPPFRLLELEDVPL